MTFRHLTTILLATCAFALSPITAHAAGKGSVGAAGMGGAGNIGSSANTGASQSISTSNQTSNTAGGGGAGNVGASASTGTGNTATNNAATANTAGTSSNTTAFTASTGVNDNNGVGAGSLANTPDLNAAANTSATANTNTTTGTGATTAAQTSAANGNLVYKPSSPAVAATTGISGTAVSRNGEIRAMNPGTPIRIPGSHTVETISPTATTNTATTGTNAAVSGAAPKVVVPQTTVVLPDGTTHTAATIDTVKGSLTTQNFTTIDANHDGQLSKDEMNQFTFKAGDMNGDGVVDATEFKNFQSTVSVPDATFNKFSSNNGLTSSQYNNLIATSNFYNTFDTNHDGIVSQAEYQRALPANSITVTPSTNSVTITPGVTASGTATTGSTTILPGRL